MILNPIPVWLGSRHHSEVYFVSYSLLASAKCQLVISWPVTFGLGVKLFLLLEWDMWFPPPPCFSCVPTLWGRACTVRSALLGRILAPLCFSSLVFWVYKPGKLVKNPKWVLFGKCWGIPSALVLLAAQILLGQSVCRVPRCNQEGKEGVSGFNCVRSCIAQRLLSSSLTCKLYATCQRMILGLYMGVASFLRNSYMT